MQIIIVTELIREASLLGNSPILNYPSSPSRTFHVVMLC